MSNRNYQIGVIGELAFIQRATQHGLVVCLPFHQDSPYDLIIDDQGTLYKIQVKTSQAKQPRRNGYRFQISKSRVFKKLYDIDDIDYFACYAADIDTFWIIPYDQVSSQKTLYIKPDNPKYIPYKELFNFN